MPDSFVSLAFVLGGAHAAVSLAPLGALVRAGEAPAAASYGDLELATVAERAAEPGDARSLPSVEDVTRELTLLRLAACESYARARDRLLERLARDVLGRELALEPCDLERLARAALARFAEIEPIAIRVAPGVARGLALDVPVTADASLGPGDLVVEVRDGTIDARFALRLAHATIFEGHA